MQKRFFYHDQLEAAAQAAENQWRAGNWAAALAQYCEIFHDRWEDLQKEHLLTPADLAILERITDFAVPMGMANQCDAVLAHIVAGYHRLGFGCWADRIRVKQIHLALNGNQVDRAFSQLSELFGSSDFSINTIAQWEKCYAGEVGPDELGELFAQAWLETGRLTHLQGQNQRALLCFNLGLGHDSASPICKIHLKLAAIACLTELGQLEEVRRQLAVLKSSLEPDLSPGIVTAWHELSAKENLLRGEFGFALEHLREVWKICSQYSFVLPMLKAATNLAQGLILLNQTIEARAILQRVYAVGVERSQDLLANQARRLLDVAGVQLHGGLERAASVMDEQAATTRIDTPDPLLFQAQHQECYTLAHFEDRSLSFNWYLGLRHRVNARRCLDRLEPFRSTDSTIIHSRLDAMRAMLEYYDGKMPLAEQLLHKARNAFLKLGLHLERWQIQVLWNRCLERLEVPPFERANLAHENEALLESFGASLPLRDRVTFFLDKATQVDESLASKIRKLQELQSRMSTSGFFGRLCLRFALWKGLNDFLDEAYWQKEAHNSGLLDSAAGYDAVRKRTPLWRRILLTSPFEATLAFIVFPDSTVGICRRWLSLEFWVSSLDKKNLRRMIGKWHRLIPQANPEERDATLRDITRQLGTQHLGLDQIVTSLPRHVKRLRILPDDILHGLPFAAIELPHPTSCPYRLGERFSISIAFQPEKRVRKRRTAQEKPLLVGVMAGSDHLPPLMRTPEQLCWVQQWLRRRGHECYPLFDEAASPEMVSDQLTKATFFHISCHGEFVQGKPERTGLILKTPQGSQVLSLPELSKLRLEQLRHATLISCWGADNFILPGRWILSLPHVLWRVGTPSILASLWEIEDDIAEKFVELFYKALGSGSPEVALSCAQEGMRKSGGKYRDVRQWAGFQIYGDPQPLAF